MQKGIRIYAVKGNWQLNNSIQSKIVAMAFAMAAEIERDLISQRTTEALQARKQQGIALGQPKGVGKSKLGIYRTEIEALLKNGTTRTWISKKYGTTRRNLTHWMKQRHITEEHHLNENQREVSHMVQTGTFAWLCRLKE